MLHLYVSLMWICLIWRFRSCLVAHFCSQMLHLVTLLWQCSFIMCFLILLNKNFLSQSWHATFLPSSSFSTLGGFVKSILLSWTYWWTLGELVPSEGRVYHLSFVCAWRKCTLYLSLSKKKVDATRLEKKQKNRFKKVILKFAKEIKHVWRKPKEDATLFTACCLLLMSTVDVEC